MKRLLVILFLLGAFVFYSHADEKDKNIPWYLSSPGHYSYSTYPPSLFDPDYLDKHNRWQKYFNSFTYRPQRSAIIVPRPPSFGESFVRGFSKGMSMSVDNYFREKEHRRYTEAMMGLIKLKWASEGYYSKPKYSQPHEYRNEYKMSPQEERANRERIIELDRIIKLKKERASLDKLFREAGWLDKDRIVYLNKYYPLPLTKETKFGWLDSFDPLGRKGSPPIPEGYELVRPGDLTKYMRSQGAMLPWEYKVKKLNEYLKAQDLPPVPENVDVNQVHDGDWIIYWDGEKWARRKK